MATHEVTTADFMQKIKDNHIALFDFWATWCGPCKAFGPIFEKSSDTHSDIYYGKVNVDQEQALAAAAQVQAIPTLIISKNGKVIGKQVGALNASQLEQVIDAAKNYKVSNAK